MASAPVVPMKDASTPPVSSSAVLLAGRPDRSPRSTRPPAAVQTQHHESVKTTSTPRVTQLNVTNRDALVGQL